MTYTLKYDKSVLKFLKKHSDLQKKFIQSLEILAKNPYQNDLDIKKLKGYEQHYR